MRPPSKPPPSNTDSLSIAVPLAISAMSVSHAMRGPHRSESERALPTHLHSLSESTSASNSSTNSRSNSRSNSRPSSPPGTDMTIDRHQQAFRNLLDVDAPVDETKLRRTAAAGIPPPLRPHVWNMLLSIVALDRAQDLSRRPRRLQEYEQLSCHLPDDAKLSRSIRRLLTRSKAAYQPSETHHPPAYIRSLPSEDEQVAPLAETPPPNSPPIRVRSMCSLASSLPSADVLPSNMDAAPKAASPLPRSARRPVTRIVDTHLVARYARVISAYLENVPLIDYHDHLVFLCAPFLEVMPTEADAYFAFSALMNTHGKLFNQAGLHDAVSNFLTMFRSLEPELHEHFVAEEVDINKWARNWLRGLLVEQLPRRSLLRLWDSYFANAPLDGLLLHPYVCLVFIQHRKPDLHDCEDSESIMAVLSALPAMDIDHVIAHAKTTREQLGDQDVM